jgi:hypothetical protein
MKIERIVVGVDASENSLSPSSGLPDWLAWSTPRSGPCTPCVCSNPLGSDDPVPSFPHREKIRRLFETTWCAALDTAEVHPAVGSRMARL